MSLAERIEDTSCWRGGEGGREGGRDGGVVNRFDGRTRKRKRGGGEQKSKNKSTCSGKTLRKIPEGVDVQAVSSLCVCIMVVRRKRGRGG